MLRLEPFYFREIQDDENRRAKWANPCRLGTLKSKFSRRTQKVVNLSRSSPPGFDKFFELFPSRFTIRSVLMNIEIVEDFPKCPILQSRNTLVINVFRITQFRSFGCNLIVAGYLVPQLLQKWNRLPLKRLCIYN